MNPVVLLTIAGIDVVWNGERLSFLCGLEIDGDGSGGNAENDPCFQDDTTLHDPHDVALNARKVPWFVVPPRLIRAVPQVVLGCIGNATNAVTGQASPFVVADIGPDDKLGEGSICLAERIGVPSSPINGGITRRIIRIELFPGSAAAIDGIAYALCKYRS